MREAIEAALLAVAREHGVRILHACESGSRAWGFASPDSDWDVRFLYVHPPDWYLRVFPGTDHVGRMLPGDLDLAGWDLRKALGLFARSNAVLFEHLGSPVVYLDEGGLAARMRALVPEFFNPIAAGHHYLGLARRMQEGWLRSEQVNVKKLFYVLRPLCAFAWVERHGSMPPTAFAEVLPGIDLDAEQRGWVSELRARKEAAKEGCSLPLDPRIRAWIDAWVDASSTAAKSLPIRGGDVALLDQLLVSVVRGR